MTRAHIRTFILRLLLTLLALNIMPYSGEAQTTVMSRPMPGGSEPIVPGYISRSFLGDFAPISLAEPCRLLKEHHTTEAAQLFQATLVKDPASLAAYVGLSQADPAFRDAELKRLSAMPLAKLDALAEFRFGLQLFYVWGGDQTKQPSTYNQMATYYKATALLTEAWKQTHNSVAGLMAAEALNGRLDIQAQAPIFDRIISDLAGPKAAAIYAQAAKTQWLMEPPSPNLVPKGNWKALCAALNERYKLLLPRGVMLQKNDKWYIYTDLGLLPVGEVPDRYKVQAHYLQHWRDTIQTAATG